MKRYIVVISLLILSALAFAEKRAMTVEDLWAMKRIGSIELSPDGKWLAFSVTEYDMEKNSGNSDIYLMPAEGGEPRRLTSRPGTDTAPKWKPDGSGIGFISTRNGSAQIYFLSLAGGEAEQLTDFPVDVEDFVWSPQGDRIAFSANVYAKASSLEESAEMDKKKADSKVKARVIDHLLFRSWNRWTEGKRTHVFVCDTNGENFIDLTPGEYDAPPLDLGGHGDFVFSPDGKELAFVSNHDPMPAASTNNDIFLVPVSGGEAQNITAENHAVDNQPLYSPDGRYLAYSAMKRPGFEADQYEIIIRDRKSGEIRSLTESFDRNPSEVIWAPDSKSLFFTAQDAGRVKIYRVGLKSGKIEELVLDSKNGEIKISPNGTTLYFARESVTSPDEIFAFDLKSKKTTQLSFLNRELLAQLELNPVEDFWFDSFDGQKTHGLLLKPPFFDPAKKYPLLFLIHGGPQGMWDDSFHYRWNAPLFAAPGYVVVMVNPRGSKGYGQKWCDAVSKDWGGGPYKDLMAGLDWVLEEYDFIDEDKLVAAGASYGGFMINWIATHTDRFKALVSHAGVFDQKSMYGETEELWFPEWEFGGTPYEHPELYEKHSPSTYVANFKYYKTPTLVIHGEHDYRVPFTQGFQMFTALQRMGVPSRLIFFPDETHFVTKPQNARLWWTEIFAWFDKWLQN